jgi:Holliday junction resolvase RusA-like endonuclease
MEQTALLAPPQTLAPPELALPPDAEVFGVYKFKVDGKAIPQGSKKGFVDNFGHVRVVDDNKTELKRWRKTVAEAALATKPGWLPELWDGPIGLSILFVRARKPTEFLADGVTLKAGANRWPSTAPDGDKLDRSVWDALTDVLYTNDSRVIEWGGGKRFGGPGQAAHTMVDVYFLR